MKYGSVCSGIEAATVAWHPLGWQASFYSEIEAFPRAVLKHHYPTTPLHGDFTTIGEHDYDPIDLLVGGTPCQSFSVAGLRGGISDDRGNLALEYLRLAQRKKPRWILWENVPGVLSSTTHDSPDPCPPPAPLDMERGGQTMVTRDEYSAEELHAFNCFLAGLSELGYGYSTRILDAQYFGVPQRRRRVFVVGYLGDWRPAAAVLFESESLQRDLTPSRKEREGFTAFTPSSFGKYSEGVGTLKANGGGIGGGSETLITNKQWSADTASTLDAHFGDKLGLENQHINAGCPLFVPAIKPIVCTLGHTSSNGLGISESETANTLEATASCNQAIAFNKRPMEMSTSDKHFYTLRATDYKDGQCVFTPASPLTFKVRGGCEGGGKGYLGSEDKAFTVTTTDDQNLFHNNSVRRLTPTECERLQGFPDGYTLILNSRGKEYGDAPRYKALGNSMAVPVMHWLGKRIQLVENML